MSRCREEEVRCGGCGELHRVRVWQSVNVTLDASLRTALFDDELNVLRCRCGQRSELACDLLYNDMRRRFAVWLLYPNEQGVIEAGPELGYGLESFRGFRLRIVPTRSHLVEKVRIFEAGLDDRAIELLKQRSADRLGARARHLRFQRMQPGARGHGQLELVDLADPDAPPLHLPGEEYDELAAGLDPEPQQPDWQFVVSR